MIRTFHRIPHELGVKILQKFNCTCQKCGSKTDITVHHIERVEFDSPIYTDKSNLTLLCRSCHMAHHRLNGDIVSTGAGAPKGSRNNPNGRRVTSEPIQCTEPGCNELQHAKLLCRKHYNAINSFRWNNRR